MDEIIRKLFEQGDFLTIVETLREKAAFQDEGETDVHFLYYLARAEIFFLHAKFYDATDNVNKAARIHPTDIRVQNLRQRINQNHLTKEEHPPFMPPKPRGEVIQAQKYPQDPPYPHR